MSCKCGLMKPTINRVSRPFQENHAEIPWRQIINQRNVLAHEYGEIRHELIWNVIDHGSNPGTRRTARKTCARGIRIAGFILVPKVGIEPTRGVSLTGF